MNKKNRNGRKYGFLLLITAIILLLFPLSIKFINDALLNNAQRMGEEIARRFAVNEETYLNQYETILRTVEYQVHIRCGIPQRTGILPPYWKITRNM